MMQRGPSLGWFFRPRRVPARLLFKVTGTDNSQLSKNKEIVGTIGLAPFGKVPAANCTD